MSSHNIKTLDVPYTAGSAESIGVLAFDESLSSRRPGVLVIHEAWGLGAHTMDRARMLAELGYVAFAADMYGGRRILNDLQSALETTRAIRTEAGELLKRVNAAMSILAAQSTTDATRMAAIGYCFGGGAVLDLARSGATLRGVVSFHGSLKTVTPAAKDSINTKILVCTGGDDPMCPIEQVVEFESEMKKAAADYQIAVYGGTQHSFTNPYADSSIMPGIAYHELSDRRSWALMQQFLTEVFSEPQSK